MSTEDARRERIEPEYWSADELAEEVRANPLKAAELLLAAERHVTSLETELARYRTPGDVEEAMAILAAIAKDFRGPTAVRRQKAVRAALTTITAALAERDAEIERLTAAVQQWEAIQPLITKESCERVARIAHPGERIPWQAFLVAPSKLKPATETDTCDCGSIIEDGRPIEGPGCPECLGIDEDGGKE